MKLWMLGLVWACSFVLILLFSFNTWFLENMDHVEFLATANNWVHGNGFINPLKTIYNIKTTAPIPAFSFRGVLYPFILALFLKVSPHLWGLKVMNSFLASLVPTTAFILAEYFWGKKTAIIGTLVFFTSPGWFYISKTPWSEPLVCLMWLLIMCVWFLPKPSFKQALFTGILSSIAWTAKPQIDFFIPLLGLSLLVSQGWGRLIKNKFYWIAALTYFFITIFIKIYFHWETGSFPYQGYGAWLHATSNDYALLYQTDYSQPVWQFVFNHWDAVWTGIKLNLSSFTKMMMKGYYSYLALLFLPVLVQGLTPQKKSSRNFFISLSILFLLLLNWGLWNITSADRSYLLPLLLLNFLCAGYLQKWIEKYFTPAMALSLLLTIPLTAFGLMDSRKNYIHNSLADGFPQLQAIYSPICPLLQDKVTAAINGWYLFEICGNPVSILPHDINNEAILAKFIQQEKVSFVLVDDTLSYEVIRNSPQLKLVATLPMGKKPTQRLYQTHLELPPLKLNPAPTTYEWLREDTIRINALRNAENIESKTE